MKTAWIIAGLLAGCKCLWAQAPNPLATPNLQAPAAPALTRPPGQAIKGMTPRIEEALRKMAGAFASAASYKDEGRAIITQTTGKVRVTTEVPMSLAFERPNRLRLDGGQYEAWCDGKKLVFAVPSLGQHTEQEAPAKLERSQLPSGSILGGADEGHPEILDLLTRDNALAKFLAAITQVELASDDQHTLVLAYETAGKTKAQLFLDTKRHCLLRFVGVSEQITQGKLPTKTELRYELGRVRLGEPVEAGCFAIGLPAESRRVAAIGEEESHEHPESPHQPEGGHLLGKEMPSLLGTKDLDGREFREETRGKPQLLFFWGTSGGPHSLVAIPVVQKIAERFGARLGVLGINTDAEPLPTAKQLLERKEAKYRCLTDADHALRKAFALAGIPTFVLVDGKGVMRWAKLGAPPTLEEDLRGEIEKLLATPEK